MDLRSIRYFLAVADAGSITEAARTLHLSQPPLSSAMAKLEAELGVTLFDRLPRGVELTEAGRYLRAAGRRLLAEEDRLSSTLRSMGRGLEGELRIGAEPMGLWRVVSDRIASFLDLHPRVSLELMDASPRVQVEHLATGHLDVAVIPVLPEEPLPHVHGVTFTVEIVEAIPLTLIAPTSWGLSANTSVDLRDLTDRTWILPGPLPGARSLSRLLDDRFAALGRRPARVITVPTVQSAASLVAVGMGITVISSEMAEVRPRVTAIPVRGGWPDLPLGLVRRKEGIVTPVAERFIELFRTT